MRNVRFSVAELFAAVAFIAVSAGALLNAGPAWSTCLYSAAVALLATALVAARFCHGRAKAFWWGLAVCGWVYWLLTLSPWISPQTSDRLVTTQLLRLAHPALSKARRERWGLSEVPPEAEITGRSDDMIDYIYDDGRRGRIDISPWSSPWRHWETTATVGHSLLTILCGVAGGMVARRLARDAVPGAS